MFTSLRARLWLTYAVLILLILCILGVGMFVYIIRNPLIDRQGLTRLDAAMTLIQRQVNDRVLLPGDRDGLFNRIGNSLDIRLLVFSPSGELEQDSQPDSPAINWPASDSKLVPKGRIADQQGDSWLYSSWVLNSGETLVLAIPRQGGLQLLRSPRLRETLRDDFLPTFLRVGVIAFILALIFSVWMGNWVAGPLQDIEYAARSLPDGNYQEIPVKGPEEVRALAEAYNEMVGQVEATQQSQRDFVANVSHELKTPLTSIQGFSGAMLDGTVDGGPALKKAAGIIKTEADRMYRLVVDLLDLARFDAGTVVLDRQLVDLERVINRVETQLIPQAAEAQVKLETDLQPLPSCVGDADRLSQVFTNLVDNAIKHTPAGGFVKLTSRRDGNQILVQVIDSGEGIAPEHLSRIFERFYKVDGSRKQESRPNTGLGLAISQQIILAHDGEIDVRSIPGEGTAFEVLLPATDTNDQTLTEQRRENSG